MPEKDLPKLPRWPAFIKGGKLFAQFAMNDLKENGQCYGLGLVWCELAVAARHRARHDHVEAASSAREYTPSEMLVLLARKLHARKAKCLSRTFSSFAGFKYMFTWKSKALNRLHRRIRGYQASQKVKKMPDEYLEVEQKLKALRSNSRELKSRGDAMAERQKRLLVEFEVLRQELLAAAGSDRYPKIRHQLVVKLKEMKTTNAALIRAHNERCEVVYEIKRLGYCQIAMKEEFELARIPTVNTSGYEGRYTIGTIESEEDMEIEAESIKDSFCLDDDSLENDKAIYANEDRFYLLSLDSEKGRHAIYIQAPTEGVSDFTVFCANIGEVQVEAANLGRFLLSYMKEKGYKSFDATRLDFNVERCLELAHSDLAELAPDAESHTTQAFDRKFK